MQEKRYCKIYINKEDLDNNPDLFRIVVDIYNLTVLRAQESFKRQGIEYICTSPNHGYVLRPGYEIPILDIGDTIEGYKEI